jgi:hypothetical protein
MVLGDIEVSPSTCAKPCLELLLRIAEVAVTAKPTRNTVDSTVAVAFTVMYINIQIYVLKHETCKQRAWYALSRLGNVFR